MPRGKQSGDLLTQQKVLRAAVALFLEKGYTKTTIGEIARVAGSEVLSAEQEFFGNYLLDSSFGGAPIIYFIVF